MSALQQFKHETKGVRNGATPTRLLAISKKTIGIFSILSILLSLMGAGLIVVGIIGSPLTTAVHSTGFANLPLFVTGVVIASLALALHLIAWVGALTNLARLQYWGWFVLVLVFHGLAVLVYLIVAPPTPASVTSYVQKEVP